MKKTKVVIASILKPIDDTRMLEKFGLSLAETNEYEINIIGFDSKNVRSHKDIAFHPLKPFARDSFSRLLKPWKVFKVYTKVKPKVIIVNTHELLIVTSLYKILFGGKFVYDVRENYAKNIQNTRVFRPVLRPILSSWVRLKEWVSKPWVNHYILAEKVYRDQLPFLSSAQTVIENKYAPQENERTAYRNPDPSHLDLVFTGTIGESNGVFEAISITKKLHQANSNTRLRIVGFCALKSDLIRLKEEIKGYDYIELNGGDHLVPHAEIIEAIQKADFGFVLKKPNQGMNEEKMLTRLFEYTAHRLPMLVLNNLTWVEFCEQFDAAIIVNPKDFDAAATVQKMQEQQFYTKGDTSQSLWATEEGKLIELLQKV